MSEVKAFGNGAKFYNMTMVMREDGKVLVLDRIKTDWPGLTFPGGKVEAGESFAASAIREIHEETGLSVSRVIPCGTVHWAHKETGHRYIEFLYKALEFEGEFLELREVVVPDNLKKFIIDWGKSPRCWHQKVTDKKKIIEII